MRSDVGGEDPVSSKMIDDATCDDVMPLLTAIGQDTAKEEHQVGGMLGGSALQRDITSHGLGNIQKT